MPSAPTPVEPRPILAIVMRLGAAAALSCMFTLVKLSAMRGVHAVEAVFYRQLLALPLILGWAAIGPGLSSLRTDRMRLHASRMVVGLIAMSLNFAGMALLPLAEATAIGFTVPLFATVAAALFLRERVGIWRWSAIALGLAGTLIVVDPSGAALSGHGAGVAVALAGAAMTAAVTILVRQLGATEPATRTVFWFTLLSLVPLAPLMLWFGRAHDPTTFGLLLAMGLAGGVAQILLTAALRLAPVGVVLPMDYSSLIWASLLGWLAFATLPATTTLIGAPIIVTSGLIILWREGVRNRRRPAAPV